MMSPDSTRSTAQALSRASGCWGFFRYSDVHRLEGQAGLVGGFAVDQAANPARLDAFDHLLVSGVGARLKIHQKAKLVRARRLAALSNGLAARHIHRDRFGEIHMFARRNSGGRLLRMEVGRAFDGHRLDLRLQQPLIAGQARESLGRRDIELLPGAIGLRREIIGQRGEVVTAVLEEQIGDPLAAPAAANQPQVDLAAGLRAARQAGRPRAESHGCGPRARQKMPTADGLPVQSDDEVVLCHIRFAC